MMANESMPILANTPRDLNIADFVVNRMDEIVDLLNVIDNHELPIGEVTQGPRTTLQRLPRHMRRRAMSYNVKRLPRNRRHFAMINTAMSMKRRRDMATSRRWRRRPHNLLKDYIRRQREQIWLETHIWHAKRFRMVDLFGYRLPECSYQRGFRPAYRDAVGHCLIRDQSYLRCFELTGDEDYLLGCLALICHSSVSPTFAYRACQRRSHIESQIIVYAINRYPHDCIGPVRVMWMPATANQHNNRRTLWIWSHPAAGDRLLKELIELFRLKKYNIDNANTTTTMTGTLRDRWHAERMKKMHTIVYRNDDDHQCITLTDLKDQLVRFSLTGRQSIAVVTHVLKCIDLHANARVYPDWLTEEAKSTFELHHTQWSEEFRGRTAAEFVDGHLISLLVEDPRISRPTAAKRRDAYVNPSTTNNAQLLTPSSIIWNSDVRQAVFSAKLSDAELQELARSSASAMVLETPVMLPIMLVIRNPSSSIAGFGSGLDLIAPAGFGMALWTALQYGTAHAGGLREQRSIAFESGRFAYPDDIPDCTAGAQLVEHESNLLSLKHKRRPRNRRIAYWPRLSVRYPFTYEWQRLVDECNNNNTSSDGNRDNLFYVLRDRRLLLAIDQWLRGKSIKPAIIVEHYRALVPIRLECVNRGRPTRRALVCLPTLDDINNIKSTSHRICLREPTKDVENGKMANDRNKKKNTDPIESYVSLSSEVNVDLRTLFPDTEAEKERKRILKRRENRKKFKNRKKSLTNNDDMTTIDCGNDKDDSVGYRRVIGRIVRGDYSFGAARGRAFGYCPLSILDAIIAVRSMVLIRNTSSIYYHWAHLIIDTGAMDI